MTHTSSSTVRRRARLSLAAVAGLALVAGISVTATSQASATASRSSSVTNPYSPAYGHPYRHGAIPTRSQQAKMDAYQATHSNAVAAATGPETLSYGGGIDGTGVMSGAKSQVYLVFYGNQWGSSSTDGNGNLKFSNDSAGAAGVAQQMFKGIGTGSELWSADLTQWCDGSTVSTGAVSCPSNTPASAFVPYQSGGVLAGVWYDNSTAEPQTASGHQLGVEALAAAHHFGNTSAAANRHAFYVILSPTGTNPDSYQGAYCAWHDYNGDTTLTGGAISSDVGDFAFSNQPYNIDSGAGCGVGFVNSPGTLDGYTITLGHEWHETLSDQNPAGGWTNNTGSSFQGQENSDECAWISPGTTGGAANVTMGNGTYAEQASWSNDTNACAISHPIVNHGGGGNTVTVTNPGSQSSTVGTVVSLQIHATDSGSSALTYTASGLPAGLSINSSSGLVSGTPTTAATYSTKVTATDTTGASGSASFTWTVSSSGGGGGNVIVNGGFETGSLSGWTASGAAHSVTTSGPHSGTYAALLGSTSPTNGNSSIAQTFTAKSGDTKLTFWYNVTCPDTVTYDWATATLKDNTTGTTATVLAKTCASNSGWVQKTATITAGHSYTLTLTSKDDNYPGDPTYTKYDDVATS